MKKGYIVSLAILLLLLLIGYGVYKYVLSTQSDFSTPLPQISLGSLVDARLHSIKNGMITDISFIPEGSIVSRTRRHDIGVTASIVMPSNEIGNIIVIENENGNQQLDDPSSIKDAIAISPDGKYLAYAEMNLDFGTTLYSENISDWNIKILELATGEVIDVGVGFAPYFIKEDTLIVVFTTPDGIGGYSIESGDQFVVYPELGSQITTQTAHVSPDGNYLAVFNSVTDRYGIFTIHDIEPLLINGFGETQTTMSEIAVTNEYIYGTVLNEETFEHRFIRYSIEDLSLPFAEAEELFIFGSDRIPYQIIP